MLRTTTTAAVRAFKPVQVSAITRRAYSSKPLDDRESAAENRYIREKARFCCDPMTREAEQIKKLKEEIAKKNKEIEELKKANK
ncbi:hypothetical protein BGX28_002616 [Mortierella sp. GBA30]|nr:hypothetical protein BGX28_002616 [Mortierella sp. GBA30]